MFKKIFAKIMGWPVVLWNYVIGLEDKLKNVWTGKAVEVTNIIKDVLNNKILDVITALTKTTADEKILLIARTVISKVVAQLITYKELPHNATQAEIQAFFEDAAKLFGFKLEADKAKFYSTLAAELKIQFDAAFSDGKLTFGEAVALVEAFYTIKNNK